MPKRYMELPTRGIAVSDTNANIVNAQIDEQGSKQVSRVNTKADELIIESTFSNVAEGDTSCLAFESIATGGGQSATLEYLGGS